MSTTLTALNCLSAIAGFDAAFCWYLSARGRVPPMLTYWDATPENDPFFSAIRSTAKWNKFAAAWACAAATTQALSTALSSFNSH